MERYVICVIIAFFSVTQAQQFRSDYKYNAETNAFYKLHLDAASISRAEEVCRIEGAALMVVSSNVDVAQAISMLEQYPTFENAWIKNDEREFAKVSPTDPFDDYSNKCKVLVNTWTVESRSCYNNLLFICKVNASNVYYDSKCQVFGTDYEYVAETNSCYRIPKVAMTWDEANNECNAQDSHLVIINSVTEKKAALQIYAKNPNIRAVSERWWWFFAGFRANDSRVFKTVLNQTLEEAGFVNWELNEPNNAGDGEDCGAVFGENGEFNDVDCSYKLPFICEKNII